MKFFSILSVLFLVAISIDPASCTFNTGPKYWDTQKQQSRVMANLVYRPKHAQFADEAGDKTAMFKVMLSTHEAKEVFCPEVFKLANCIDKDLSLSFQVDPSGATQLKIFLAFNEAMLELIDMEQELLQASKYCYKDLELIKVFYTDSLVFIKKSEAVCLSLLDNKENTFSEKTFRSSLKLSYVPADVLNQNIEKMRETVRTHCDSVLSLQQYVKYFSYIRYVMHRNGLAFVTAHLNSKDAITKTFLKPNRKVEAGIKGFNFDLLKGLEDLEFSNFELNANESISVSNELKRKGVTKKELPNESISQSLGSKDQLESIAIVETKEPNPSTMAGTLVEEEAKDTSVVSSSIIEIPNIEIKTEDTMVIENQQEELEAINATNLPEINQLDELDVLLQQYDGGPQKGMKTRRFLRLCAALNKMGCFSSFKANEKEVKLKTHPANGQPGEVAILHMNHSNNRKDTGITRPTAQRLADIIAWLKEQRQ